MGRVPWEHMATLTFDPKRTFPVGAEKASREAWWWCTELGRLFRRPVAWVFATERGSTGLWHVHALVTGLDDKPLAPAIGMWEARNGIAHVSAVWAGGGAVLYTTKVAAQRGEVVLSDTLVRYRDHLHSDFFVRLAPDCPEDGR